jgi:hypothetical protein
MTKERRLTMIYINALVEIFTGIIQRVRCKIIKSFTVFQSRLYCLYRGCQEIAWLVEGSSHQDASPHNVATTAATSLRAASCEAFVNPSLDGVPLMGVLGRAALVSSSSVARTTLSSSTRPVAANMTLQVPSAEVAGTAYTASTTPAEAVEISGKREKLICECVSDNVGGSLAASS